jgi:hypothetical protein
MLVQRVYSRSCTWNVPFYKVTTTYIDSADCVYWMSWVRSKNQFTAMYYFHSIQVTGRYWSPAARCEDLRRMTGQPAWSWPSLMTPLGQCLQRTMQGSNQIFFPTSDREGGHSLKVCDSSRCILEEAIYDVPPCKLHIMSLIYVHDCFCPWRVVGKET